MVTANSRNSRPMMPPMKSTGMKTAASETVMLRIVKLISREPSSDACSGVCAALDVPHDVLEHHDRIVHDETDREDQRHQRQVVEAEVQQPHHDERAENRERQGQRRE